MFHQIFQHIGLVEYDSRHLSFLSNVGARDFIFDLLLDKVHFYKLGNPLSICCFGISALNVWV